MRDDFPLRNQVRHICHKFGGVGMDISPSCSPDDGHLFSGLYFQVNIPQNRLVPGTIETLQLMSVECRVNSYLDSIAYL